MPTKKIAALTLFFLATSSNAQDFDNVVVTNECHLAKSGSFNKTIIYRGARTAVGCEIVIPTQEFKKQYSYCALSGVYHSSDGGHICKFGTYDTDGHKVSFLTAKATCEFVCVKR